MRPIHIPALTSSRLLGATQRQLAACMSVYVHEMSNSARVKWRVMNAWAVCTCTKMQCMNEQRVQVQSVSDMKISIAINETARKK